MIRGTSFQSKIMLFFQLILGNCIFKNDSSVFLALETGKINDGELFPHIKRGAYRYIIHSLIHFLEQIDHLLLSLFLIFISQRKLLTLETFFHMAFCLLLWSALFSLEEGALRFSRSRLITGASCSYGLKLYVTCVARGKP